MVIDDLLSDDEEQVIAVLENAELTRAAGRATDALLVGTRVDRPLVVVAPVGVLDGIGDLLVGDKG